MKTRQQQQQKRAAEISEEARLVLTKGRLPLGAYVHARTTVPLSSVLSSISVQTFKYLGAEGRKMKYSKLPMITRHYNKIKVKLKLLLLFYL